MVFRSLSVLKVLEVLVQPGVQVNEAACEDFLLAVLRAWLCFALKQLVMYKKR